MNGKDEQTILEERAEMVSRIKEQYPDAEILESYFEDYNPSTGNVGLKYLAKSLELLADADEAWFARGGRMPADAESKMTVPLPTA